MGAVDERLKRALRNLQPQGFTTIAAVVTAVDRKALTVDVEPLDGGAEIFDVRLRAAIDDAAAGCVLLPAKGSTVLVSAINGDWNSAYVAMVSELDLLTIRTARESLKQWCHDLLATVKLITVTTPAGESKPPTNAAAFSQLQTRLDNLFLD